MSTREAYLRAVVDVQHDADKIEMIAGLEIRDEAELDQLRVALRQIMADAFWARPATPRILDYALALRIEAAVVATWPGRAWFLEIGVNADHEGYVQLYFATIATPGDAEALVLCLGCMTCHELANVPDAISAAQVAHVAAVREHGADPLWTSDENDAAAAAEEAN